MSDFEAFAGMEEGGDKVDPAVFEKFKERIKAAATQIKAIKKSEQKVRKKEDKLIKILLKFVKNSQKRDIMLLIARLLEQNISPVFILSIVLLGNEEVLNQEEDKLLLEGGKSIDDVGKEGNQALALFEENQALPLEVRVKIEDWMKNVLAQGLEKPARIVRTVFDDSGILKLPLIQLSAFILRDYLGSMKQEADYEKLKEFSDFFLNGVMKKLKKKADEVKELKKGEEKKED